MRFWFLGPQFDSGWDHFYVARVSVVGSGMEIGCIGRISDRKDNWHVVSASTKSIWDDKKQASSGGRHSHRESVTEVVIVRHLVSLILVIIIGSIVVFALLRCHFCQSGNGGIGQS